MKQKNLFLLMFSSVLLSSIFISCEGNGMYGIEENLYPCSEEMERVKTRAAYTEYLSLSTYDPKKWSQEEHDIMILAAERMGISFVNNCYVFAATSSKEVNISDSLFITVKEQFGYTNKILNEAAFKTVNRLKRGNPESTIINNCVPKAIAHMGQGAPSYDAAVAMCDKCDPGWRERGGVQSSHVGMIISKFTNVASFSSSQLPDTINFAPNNCVMLINRSGGNMDHAVNVTQITTRNKKHYFFYEDHSNSSTGGGTATESVLVRIFPFYTGASN